MSSVEDRLAKIEREIEELKKRRNPSKSNCDWPLGGDDRFKDDADLKEIFRLGKESRDQEPKKGIG
jgi:hypothetical protein